MSFNINKRDFLIKMPAVIGAATLAAPAVVNAQNYMASSSGKVGAALERELVPVTYCPVSMQKQFQSNEKAVQGKPYADFFNSDIKVPAAWANGLQHGPLPLDKTLTPGIADINKLLDASYTNAIPDSGYALLDGPCAYVQSRIEMPGVTAAMFRWWFTWHPMEKERYMLWFPQAHVDIGIQDAKRLSDTSLTYEQRLYNNPNPITEFIGASAMKMVIHFTDPVELGFDANAYKRAGFTANASGIIKPATDPNTPFIFMVHLARDTDRGLELFSRYWIGAHPQMRRFPGGADTAALVSKMGLSKDSVEQTAYDMAVHDMTEFNHLARLLPAIYAKFGRP
ncbi:MAG: 2,4-diacetylphloroglucinol specific hydrolase PhlG [Candidatus Tokpelaia hoelldobleri]|uniref:2,4-diacetylphloroglucinol specific hydrolase PhlG n=1 Tax=Candidatus Tokpelaia hoelldobleri TaxID=1902579 RepID=A0A1U9JTE5_9HYPH|nr:MAG: 2,4-diacetylphloroglucinol specific hydrolase PhlG [Candidatus Tokpelaia hoelldoblerii]